MKYRITVLVLFFSLNICLAQDPTVTELRKGSTKSVRVDPDTAKWKWKRGGVVSANLAQGSLSNWAAGGDNFSMAFNAFANYYLLYRDGRHSWDNSADFNLGYIQTTSLGSRKNDDRIDLLSKYGYNLNNKIFLSGLLNLRTQFFDGFNFNGNVKTFSSTFFAPAYILVSPGLDYKPSNKLSVFLSPITSRWIVIGNKVLAEQGLYGVPKGRNAVNEMGAFATVNYNNTFAKNITYKSRLDLFSNYRNKPGNIDLFMTNIVSFKINKYLSTTYNLDLIYDDDVRIFGANKTSPGLQIKSILGIGFLYQITPVRK